MAEQSGGLRTGRRSLPVRLREAIDAAHFEWRLSGGVIGVHVCDATAEAYQFVVPVKVTDTRELLQILLRNAAKYGFSESNGVLSHPLFRPDIDPHYIRSDVATEASHVKKVFRALGTREFVEFRVPVERHVQSEDEFEIVFHK